ncbi:DNA-directed RNA polymerase subunit omega [Paradesulfitobacterium ferrireducens]|uniref:DNA-directed RNA polymerase subunit omega n=1 Tax=Paradesulfitobacterium ferrireducens TaxID=2816476 RepID=UPI001A9047B0|nr:DNA-directed RNA polymerase subunit omega [Paradesulfitobacterium ferrireducens]
MRQPSLDVLMDQVDSKYTLVVVTAKRARSFMEDGNSEGVNKGIKPVSLALEDIAQGKIRYERTREGIK